MKWNHAHDLILKKKKKSSYSGERSHQRCWYKEKRNKGRWMLRSSQNGKRHSLKKTSEN